MVERKVPWREIFHILPSWTKEMQLHLYKQCFIGLRLALIITSVCNVRGFRIFCQDLEVWNLWSCTPWTTFKADESYYKFVKEEKATYGWENRRKTFFFLTSHPNVDMNPHNDWSKASSLFYNHYKLRKDKAKSSRVDYDKKTNKQKKAYLFICWNQSKK